jgi:hypothetical protein
MISIREAIFQQEYEANKNRYRDLYSTDIEVVRRYVEGSTRYKNLIVPEVIVEVNGHYHDHKFMQYVHSLPGEHLTMVLRYQNIIQDNKQIQKHLTKKNQNYGEREFMELLNWLSTNYHCYNDTFFPKESNEEFDVSLL